MLPAGTRGCGCVPMPGSRGRCLCGRQKQGGRRCWGLGDPRRNPPPPPPPTPFLGHLLCARLGSAGWGSAQDSPDGSGMELSTLCRGGEQDLGLPAYPPALRPQQKRHRPFSSPAPLCSRSASRTTQHLHLPLPKPGCGQDGLAAARGCATRQPRPRLGSSLPGMMGHVLCPRDSRWLLSWQRLAARPAECGRGAWTYLSAGAPLTHGAVSHRGGITRHRERLQEAGAYVV